MVRISGVLLSKNLAQKTVKIVKKYRKIGLDMKLDYELESRKIIEKLNSNLENNLKSQ